MTTDKESPPIATSPPVWEVKNVKIFMGSDMPGYNATLYHEGKRVGTIINEGCGGESLMDIEDAAALKLNDYCKTLPDADVSDMYDDGEKHTLEMDPDIFVGQLVDAYETRQEQRKWVKTAIVFRLHDDPQGQFRTVPCKPEQQGRAREQVVKKYGDKIQDILNDHHQDIIKKLIATKSNDGYGY